MLPALLYLYGRCQHDGMCVHHEEEHANQSRGLRSDETDCTGARSQGTSVPTHLALCVFAVKQRGTGLRIGNWLAI